MSFTSNRLPLPLCALLIASTLSLAGAFAVRANNAQETTRKGRTKINAQPFKDLFAKARLMVERGDIDLKQPLEVLIEADRQPDGSLSNVQVTNVRGSKDEKIKQIAGDFASTLSDSRALDYLGEEWSHVQMQLNLNETDLGVRFALDMANEQEAARKASSYNTFLSMGRMMRRGKDEGKILDNAHISADGKRVTMQVEMPRDEAAALLAKYSTKM